MITLKHITDIEELMRWRTEVICHVFNTNPTSELLEANRNFYKKHIADDSHIAYVALLDGVDVGCGAVCFYDEMPSPDNPSGRCAYLMNIYVREKSRHNHIASMIVTQLIEDSKKLGCGKIYLETTDMAHNLYAAVGFKDMKNYMKLEKGTNDNKIR